MIDRYVKGRMLTPVNNNMQISHTGLKMREWKMQEWKYRHEASGKGRGWKMREWKNRHGNAGGGKCITHTQVN